MAEYQDNMSDKQKSVFEEDLKREFLDFKTETESDLQFRIHGVAATRGATGKQFVGYDTLNQFYRGDQWDHDEPAGASQRTDNYCSKIVDTFSSLLFDAPVEINCPSIDETDEMLVMKAELKEKLLQKVYDDNDADEIVFPETSKCGSLFGDSFIKGPLLDKGEDKSKADWKIVFFNVENPANIRLIFSDENYQELYGYIDTTAISPMKAAKLYKDKLAAKGVSWEKVLKKVKGKGTRQFRSSPNINAQQTNQMLLDRSEYWTKDLCAIFLADELVEYYKHDWDFVPLIYNKNIYVPNHPYGRSDIEDVIDPQLAHNETNNQLANALKFLSTITLKGKNLDGMEVLVHGISKIFNIPEDGELDPIQRSGDPYASSNYVEGRRRAVLDISGLSEAMMSSMTTSNPSGRAMSMAMQSVIRVLTPKIKRYQKGLRQLNSNILKLMEKYWPETKEIIMGDYTSKVSIISTLTRNIIDELNKLQAGVQSLTSTQTALGIPQPKIEQKRMKMDLADPVLGPQIARQPGLLQVQVQNPEGTPPTEGSNGAGLPPTANQGGTQASPEGAVAGANQRASGAAPSPITA